MKIFGLRNISYSYKGRTALENVSFDISQGESISILGANGSGKSTLLYMLQGLLKPSSGELSAFEKEASGMIDPRISMLFQNSQAQLFCLSVWDELVSGPLQRGMGATAANERAEDILQLLAIGHLKDRSPWQLSGGEMKKVALGTCLSTNPDVLLLDEPTAGLDPRSQVEFMELIAGLRKAGKTIITATHDLHIIQDLSERAIVLGENHRLLEDGLPAKVLAKKDVLLKANLIHEHMHAHEGYKHEHSHFGAHDHNEIKQEPAAFKEVQVDAKLKVLLEHWKEHNEEHATTYLEWAEKARKEGNAALAEILKKIAKESKNLSGLFEEAKHKL
ncbi:MAG: ABC transporter ATP-binding protein [Actinomycetota bacterium]|nr:ABC transporter ATP-binding protein [Actinomycetota bacterium]